MEKLIAMEIPFGYYIMGTYLELGYGVEQDIDAAFHFMLKAAVMGNPDGQYVIGQKFLLRSSPIFKLEMGRKMLACAAEQGNNQAAYMLALDYGLEQKSKALYYYQKAAEYSHSIGAYTLAGIFNTNNPSNIDYLAQQIDPERVRRYMLIRKELKSNPYAKFPDINDIVPLPPAKLPEWDGSFAYKQDDERQD